MRRLAATVGSLVYRSGQSPGGDWRHGMQLAAAVIAAYACSAALRLPEGLWAVMSALIVLRPTASATAGAGWDRVRGTLAGTAIALLAVAVLHADRSTPLLLLAVVLATAVCAGLYPSLRSAPVSALIVLSAAADPAHPVLQLALLRSAEIALGVAVGLAVSWALPVMSSRRRFQARCALVLREIAGEVQRGLAPSPAAGQEKSLLRHELRALAVLAVNADHEARLAGFLRRRRPEAADSDRHQRIAQLLARTAHDAALFARIADPAIAPKADEAAARSALCDRITAALRSVADAMDGRLAAGAPEAGRRVRELLPAETEPALPWALAPAKLLMRDLAGLLRA
jgi:uncharacterized membrane protein YccC